MRVLIAQPILARLGAVTAIVHLSKYLTSNGIKNRIVSSIATNNFIKLARSLNLDVVTKTIYSSYDYITKESSAHRILSDFSDTLILRKLIAAHKSDYDLINPHNFPANWASILHKKPVVWMMNEPLDIYSTTTPSFLLKAVRYMGIKADRFLVRNYINQICVNSYVTYRQAKQRYGKTPEVVFFGVDFDKYRNGYPDKVIEKFGLEGRFVVLTSAGVLCPQKNQLASIKAIEKIKKYIPNVKLVLTGGGEKEYIHMLKEYVRRTKLNHYVTFAGFLSQSEITNLYHACHLGLYPTKEQGGLLAPFENLCAGKPIIVSPKNGTAELIKRYRLGVVTNNYDNAILDIYNNYNRYKNMAQSAKEIVKREFSWEKYGERFLSVFEECYNASLAQPHQMRSIGLRIS